MHLDIDKYAHIHSPVHRWDPRIKIASLGLFIVTIAILNKLPLIVIAFSISSLLVIVSRLPFSFVTRRLLPVTIFLSPFFIIIPLTMPGDTATTLGVSFNYGGLLIAAKVYLKALSMVMLSIVMIGTAPFVDSLKAMERLGVPSFIVQMFLFTYRYIFIFLLEMKRMNRAMKSRNFIKKTDIHTVRTMGNFVGMLLVRSFEKADRVYESMLSRGYDGGLKTSFNYTIARPDYFKAAALSVACVTLLIY